MEKQFKKIKTIKRNYRIKRHFVKCAAKKQNQKNFQYRYIK